VQASEEDHSVAARSTAPASRPGDARRALAADVSAAAAGLVAGACVLLLLPGLAWWAVLLWLVLGGGVAVGAFAAVGRLDVSRRPATRVMVLVLLVGCWGFLRWSPDVREPLDPSPYQQAMTFGHSCLHGTRFDPDHATVELAVDSGDVTLNSGSVAVTLHTGRGLFARTHPADATSRQHLREVGCRED
jgi:hypothetical protein